MKYPSSRSALCTAILMILTQLLFSGFAISCINPSEPFPAPTLKPDDIDVRSIFQSLEARLAQIVCDGKAPWNTSVTSFAIEVTSAETTLWRSYHTAPQWGEYPDSQNITVDGQKAFRIASISKVFTVLAILLQQQEGNLSMKDPVTKYIPELAEGSNDGGTQWDRISLESLASQLSGVAREYGQSDLSDRLVQQSWYGIDDAVGIGLPPLSDEELPTCGSNHVTSKTCFKKDIIEGSKRRNPVFPPNYQSTYSNIAFVLLGFVLEKVSGRTYQEALDSSILRPLGMRKTTVRKPEDSEGVIPAMRNDWYYIAGAYDPTGGIYSTSSDLSRFLRGILNSELLDEATTNAWFKPHSWSSGLTATYGMPWEIFRTTTLLPDTDRGITFVTKAGALFAYVSHIVLMPEYDLGFTILVAGDSKALSWLDNEVITTVVNGVEKIARDQTKEKYSGFYESPTLNSSLTLEVDGSSGLVVQSWISNGTDFLREFTHLMTGERNIDQGRVQLVPAKIRPIDGVESWRATVVPNDRKSKGVIDFCLINDVDSFIYGERSMQQFDFAFDEHGEVNGVILPAFRVTLHKTKPATSSARSSETWLRIQNFIQGKLPLGLDEL